MTDRYQKRQDEYLQLLSEARGMSYDERVWRKNLVVSAITLARRIARAVDVVSRINPLGSALSLLADTRDLTGEIGELLVSSRDFQYRSRRLLGGGEVGRRRRDGGSGPGPLIREYMARSSVTEREFAELAGIEPRVLSGVLANAIPIGIGLAKILEEATDISAEGWLMTSMTYHLAHSPELKREDVIAIRERFKRGI